MPAKVQEEASALRAAAMSAAEPVYVAEGIVGAPPQVELWRPNRQILDQPNQPPMPALEAPRGGQPTRRRRRRPCPPCPASASCSPSARPSPHHNQALVAAIIQAGQREEPDWDPTVELERLHAVGRWRRWRRRPGFPRFLARVAHLGRVRRG